MTLPTSAQSLVGYPVAHFGHLLTFVQISHVMARHKQTENSDGKNILEPFSKQLKAVLLYSINCSKPP